MIKNSPEQRLNGFINVKSDLYIHKDDLKRMEKGEQARGYVERPTNSDYELINHHAFQPVKNEDVLSDNCYSVVFIMN